MDKFSRNEWLGIVIGLALGFVFCLVLIAAWPAGLEHHQHAANPSPENRGTYYEIHKTWGEWFAAIAERTSEDPVALYTLVLVAFTGLLGFATIRLWFVTGKLATGTEETAERQLRAYVSVFTVKFYCTPTAFDVRTQRTEHIQAGHWAHASVHLKNAGVTPAHFFGG